MDSKKLATFHLETALKLTSREFIEHWLTESKESKESKRGRRPGAAIADLRCSWMMADSSQCKNKKQDDSSFCKIHIGKIHLVDE